MLTLLHGDALTKLAEVESESVQCVVTSPPYWGLRDYGVEDQLGLEDSPDEYVRALVTVFDAVWRVLRNDGTVWLNLGDTYSAHKDCKSVSQTLAVGGSREQAHVIAKGKSVSRDSRKMKAAGLKNKDLVGIPWRVAFELQAYGWYLRSDIIWSKPNPMPESVTDRPTKSHEYIFLLTKSERYYYDGDAIAEPVTQSSIERISQPNFANQQGGPKDYRNGINPNRSMRSTVENFAKNIQGNMIDRGITRTTEGLNLKTAEEKLRPDGMRNRRTVWSITTRPFSEAHFATFPTEIPRICILAGTKAGDTVLDPFAGSGTTGKVAIELGRKAILIEPKDEYVEMIERRCKTTIGLPLAI